MHHSDSCKKTKGLVKFSLVIFDMLLSKILCRIWVCKKWAYVLTRNWGNLEQAVQFFSFSYALGYIYLCQKSPRKWFSYTVKPPYSKHSFQQTPLYNGHFSRDIRIGNDQNSHKKNLCNVHFIANTITDSVPIYITP